MLCIIHFNCRCRKIKQAPGRKFANIGGFIQSKLANLTPTRGPRVTIRQVPTRQGKPVIHIATAGTRQITLSNDQRDLRGSDGAKYESALTRNCSSREHISTALKPPSASSDLLAHFFRPPPELTSTTAIGHKQSTDSRHHDPRTPAPDSGTEDDEDVVYKRMMQQLESAVDNLIREGEIGCFYGTFLI